MDPCVIKCCVCGRFVGFKDKIETKRVYDHSGAVEDIIYHLKCKIDVK